MNKSRRIGAIVAMATAAVGMASVAATAPASAAVRGPQPVFGWLRAVSVHNTSWVNVYWRTNLPICDVEVMVAGRGVGVDYPGHRRSTSFVRTDSLRPGRTDYTPIIVNPAFDRPGIAKLRTVIRYDDCSRRARTQSRIFTLALPIVRDHNWPGHGLPGGGQGNGNPGQHHGPGQGQDQGPWQGHGPTTRPTDGPTSWPTSRPASWPTSRPASWPTSRPTRWPTSRPTDSDIELGRPGR